MKIEPTYVDYELAKWLKEKGFDLEVLHYYIDVNGNHSNHPTRTFDNKIVNWNSVQRRVSCPEQWQVVEWLRVNHGIWVRSTDVGGTDLDYKMVIRPLSSHWNYKSEKLFSPNWYAMEFQGDTPQEAYSAAFDYILKELI